MLKVDELVVRYGARVALDGVDLVVGDGELVAVLGPSGCGKSTLLRAVAGLEPATGGRVTWDGRDLAGVPVHRRGFGLMFQDFALFPHRDVAANVGFGLRMQRQPRARASARVGEVLTLVGLQGQGVRSVATLSGGEQQRVALARALAPEPRLLMLDEPMGSLDRTLRDRLVVDLRALLRGLGQSALYVTHDQDEAFSLADRVVVLRAGRVEQTGAPEDVWRRPATEFVARFLGFSIVIDAGRLRSWGVPLEVPDDRRVVVRPDAVRLASDGALQATVESRTFQGDHILLQARTPDGTQLEVAAQGSHQASEGDLVHLEVDPAELTVLDG